VDTEIEGSEANGIVAIIVENIEASDGSGGQK